MTYQECSVTPPIVVVESTLHAIVDASRQLHALRAYLKTLACGDPDLERQLAKRSYNLVQVDRKKSSPPLAAA